MASHDEGKRCAETLFFDYHRQHKLRIKVARILSRWKIFPVAATLPRRRRKLSGYRGKLRELERDHGMSTDAFLQRFEAGDLGDAGEWFDWEAIAALKAEAERKLGELERAGV